VEPETLEGDEEADEDCEVVVKTLEKDEEANMENVEEKVDELKLDEDEVELETEVTELEVEVEPDAVGTLEELEEIPVAVDIEVKAPDGSGAETPTVSGTSGDISTTTPGAEGTVLSDILPSNSVFSARFLFHPNQSQDRRCQWKPRDDCPCL
jgi:hypothetical protein